MRYEHRSCNSLHAWPLGKEDTLVFGRSLGRCCYLRYSHASTYPSCLFTCILLGSHALLIVFVNHLSHQVLSITRHILSHSYLLIGDSVQNRTQIHVFGPVAQQRAKVEQFLSLCKDFCDYTAQREDVGAPATGNRHSSELLNVARLIGGNAAVRVGRRVGGCGGVISR